MASYNAVNGIPMTANPLLKSLGMKQWGFNGLIDTDRASLNNMVTKHKYYPDMEHSVAGAIHVGVNQFLNGYVDPLHKALQDKLVTEADIDENLRGVFRVLIRAGLLDPPTHVPYTTIKADTGAAPWDLPEVKDLVLQITRESVVLLKNAPQGKTASLLPLDASKLKSIAVLGPRADEVDSDSYGGTPPFTITPLQGIKDEVGLGTAVRYSADHDEAITIAKTSDAAIVVIGNQPTCNAPVTLCPDPSEGKEAFDRKDISLNAEQEKLVEEVYAVNPRTVVVLISSFPYTVNWEEQHIPAIVHLAHSSETEGEALADVLFGAYDPAGRLVVTWPQSLSQLPPMMDYDIRHGRTYMYMKENPLYPFGYGLSYTKFKYSRLRLSSKRMSQNGQVTVSVNITNIGKRTGEEVTQMYVQHLGTQTDLPREELKGFERVSLRVGEMKTISFHLPAKALAYWDEGRNDWQIGHDRVRVMIGSSSANIKAASVIAITE